MWIKYAIISIALLLPLSSAQEGNTGASSATFRAGYSCDPTICKLPKCACPTLQAPWNLTSSTRLPMLATLTFDDAVNSVILSSILSTIGNNTNPNGCPISSTFFVSTQYTEFGLVQALYAAGHEIAVHTVDHLADPSSDEIESAYTALSKWAGIPSSRIRGFRTPFLNYTTNTFKNLALNGHFLYDSSMPVNSSALPVWPYTMDNGIPIDCVTGSCDNTAKFPGLWEIPMMDLLNLDGTENASMDPYGNASTLATDLLNTLKSNFVRHYQDPNRVPFGLYIHAATAIVEPARLQAYTAFISWTQSTYPDVYWINNQALLSFMTTPPPSDSSPHPSLGCLIYTQSPSNPEICDGRSNTGSAANFSTIDSTLVNSCYFPATQSSTTTCYGCPVAFPNTTGSGIGPTPARSDSSRTFVPDAGCSGTTVWDPITAKCIDLPVKIIGNGGLLGGLNLTNPTPVSSSKTNGTSGTTSTNGTTGNSASTSNAIGLSWSLVLKAAIGFILLFNLY